MSYVDSLKAIPSPLDKVKAFLILSKRKENDREKLLDLCGLENYRDLIRRTVISDNRQHSAQFDNLAAVYRKEIIEGYIIRGINSYPGLSKMPNRELVEYGEILGAFLVGSDLKTSQIRKFLDGIRQLENKVNKDMRDEAFSNEELILLKVQLAYAAAREDKVEPFKRVVNAAIDKVSAGGREGYDDFRKLVKFVEAVIAYHKYYGGGE